ncbi:toll/interleukin-1 receptor domain-containing protein [Vagococcus carniphilus]|uniref:Toll/interleukin-1 receptor domain-containing protein n=1 Tax=Vagococcus carniphilus TaxID=218144 RepID=A0AAW8U442_9ENTE|nr:toll/interleukin-1 receptor domain-containing protein [Vagococcus carniphilus]MDT2834326.1 toll/interleukin-1 receptor domain-containing protein [Vagococcus carniphilus]
MTIKNPKVFISYSWEDEQHLNWVKSLADRLLANGVDASIDQYDLVLGDRLPQFMEQQITASDFVIIVCTKTYKEKANSRTSGVGYEGHIISDELLTGKNERKFIPVIKDGRVYEVLPTFLSGKLSIDLSNDEYFEKGFDNLLRTIFGVKKKPAVGEIPKKIKKVHYYLLVKMKVKI